MSSCQYTTLCPTSVWFSLGWLMDSTFKPTLQHLQRIWPILCTDGSIQWWSLWIFLFPEEDWDIMWVTDHSQIENINKAGDPSVTRLIKSVAFWEMRCWAASMASRTARTLFCRDKWEILISLRLNLSLDTGFRPKGWFTYRQVWGCSLQEPHTLVQRTL